MTHFETLDHVKMRVGALPVHPSNALKYSLTWSTDGLINEYGNLCYGIEDGRKIPLQPLEGYETIELDGLLYEAFNTSGGLGTLADSSVGSVKTMNYKTLRYPGHCEKIQLLMKDLKLNEDRKTLKRVLEHAIPQTLQDVVLIYASVTGTKHGEFFEENYVKKIYPQCIKGKLWSAIQVTTASSVCCVMDIVLRNPAHTGASSRRNPSGCRIFWPTTSARVSDEYRARSAQRFGNPGRQLRRQHGQALVVGPCDRFTDPVRESGNR